MSNDYAVLRNPTALLVLRVWMERGSALPLRAYIRQTANASLGFEVTSVETDVEAAVASVRTWLQGLVDIELAESGAGPRRPGSTTGDLGDGHGSQNGASGGDPGTAA
jgi:hypothetical protein